MLREPDRQIPSFSTTRIGLLLGVPLALIVGVHAASWAAATLKSWNAGDTLTAADLNANFTALNDEVTALQGTAWTAVTFESGWSNNAAGSTFANVEYRKKGDLVYLRGIAERMTGTNRVVFTLPVGFRPQKQSAFPAPLGTYGTSPTVTSSTTRVDVRADGSIFLPLIPETFQGYVALDGIVFGVD